MIEHYLEWLSLQWKAYLEWGAPRRRQFWPVFDVWVRAGLIYRNDGDGE